MIDPSFRAVLRSRYAIRRFFFFYGVILVGLLLAMWFVAGRLTAGSAAKEVSEKFFGDFAATVAIFIVTYGFYIFLTPPGLRNAEVIPLRSPEIAQGILDIRSAASDYWFWGRSATFFRAQVLPILYELASKERRHIHLRAVVPDPNGAGNADRYVAMKRSLGEEADPRTLAANVLATVVAAAVASARNPYLHVSIGLCATVPVLRHDISSSGALITRDARSLPAILVNAGNPYYEMFRDAVENELAQSRRVTWDTAGPAFHQRNDPAIGEVLRAIDGLSIEDAEIITEAERLLESRAHRYA